jgi:hypothetical protein
MKISDCETNRIDKPTIYRRYNPFWNAYPAGDMPYRTYRRKGFIRQIQQNCFVHFIEASSLGNNEAYPEFRSKIASVQNFVIREYETAISSSTATSWPFLRGP